MNENKFICEFCSKAFSNNKNLYQHIRRIHKVEPNIPGNILCPIVECNAGVKTFERLRSHLQDFHSFQIEKDVLTFPDKSGILL